MKIRNGFVSNSSSSSFVVLLPENFIENIDFDSITQGDDEFPINSFKEMLNKFVEEEGMWMEEVGDFEDAYEYEFQDLLETLVGPYSIAEMESGPDSGQILIADVNKVKKIISKNEN